jgi:gamma-glutamylcyclotransferase (GGCT)/AIG2-like uncharacterized protein YtfP
MKTMLIFVYGTLKRGYWNHEAFMEGAEFLGECQTVSPYGMTGHGFPMIFRDRKGKPVTGELFEVPRANLPELDRLEQHYVRIRGRIRMADGRIVWASYYVVRPRQSGFTFRSNDEWDKGDAFTWHRTP